MTGMTKKTAPRRKPGGQPKETRATWDESTIAPLLDQMVADGSSLLAVCRERGISYGSVVQAIYADAGLTAMYARAKIEYVHTRVAEMDEIACTEPDVQRARLRCDNIKWESARVAPKDYGDRQQVELSGELELRSKSDAELDAEIAALTAAIGGGKPGA